MALSPWVTLRSRTNRIRVLEGGGRILPAARNLARLASPTYSYPHFCTHAPSSSRSTRDLLNYFPIDCFYRSTPPRQQNSISPLPSHQPVCGLGTFRQKLHQDSQLATDFAAVNIVSKQHSSSLSTVECSRCPWTKTIEVRHTLPFKLPFLSSPALNLLRFGRKLR